MNTTIKKTFWGGLSVAFLFFFGIQRIESTNGFAGAQSETMASDTLQQDKPIDAKVRIIGQINEPETYQPVPLLRAAPYPTGYVDSTLYRCFTSMGVVNFAPKYMHREAAGTGTAHYTYSYTVPLVGDLNGDGKPEIVALSFDGTGGTARSGSVFIFNGQTGAEIAKFPLPGNGLVATSTLHHGSPCQIALVDADRNGRAEIIVCFSESSNAPYIKQIASFEVNDNTFKPTSALSLTSNTRLTQKWLTTVRYDAWGATNSSVSSGTNNYNYPIPQVVDIDGDGTPELIVYNKIYNALNGNYIMKFGELGNHPGDATNKTAYIGSFCLIPSGASGAQEAYHESSMAFSSIYDIDGDGKYDFVAGGKIYHHINLAAKTYQTLDFSAQVKDGRTVVADIDGDGIAEVIVLRGSVVNTSIRFDWTITVWKPDFLSNTGQVVATRTFRAYNTTAWGFCSPLFIGDIDGKIQNGKRLPEISLLTGRPFKSGTSTDVNLVNIPVHPNVTDGLITTNKSLSGTGVEGCLVSFTWDNNTGVSVNDRLKVSFMLEHDDRSFNTGFSLFDFDNDGVTDICYRDEQTLRIISARKSYVRLDETASNVIRLKTTCTSFTGFEYPSIADVDGDGAADMIVIGTSSGTDHRYGYIFVVEGTYKDLAPAPSVWNQFHYHPLKINENLQTPTLTIHPLNNDYAFYKSESDANPVHIYNGNIMQAMIGSAFVAGNGKEVLKPIVLTPDLVIYDGKITGTTLSFKVKNTGNASNGSSVKYRIYQDNNLTPVTTGNVALLYPGDEATYNYTISSGSTSIFTITTGGTLNAGGGIDPVAADLLPDCNWVDNILEVAYFLLREDLVTLANHDMALVDVFANDILPCAGPTLTPASIETPAGVGVLNGDFGTVQIVNNKILYTAPGPSYGGGVVDIKYTSTCNAMTRTGHVYIYLLESCTPGGWSVCAGAPSYEVCLKKPHSAIVHQWFKSDTITVIGTTAPILSGLTVDTTFFVKPSLSAVTTGTLATYRYKNFPPGRVPVKVFGKSGIDVLRWTGTVDTNWFNPANWELASSNGQYKTVASVPSGVCFDVVLAANCPHYPELTAAANCRNIHLENRAMIAGIHRLSYERASMDFEPVRQEKNRFVMWSAPLKDMYTGDYHFPKADGLTPDWGLIYMNFFQSANPDYSASVALEKTFTATFGSMATPLPLGKGFNIRIVTDTDYKRFAFPRTATAYTDANGSVSAALPRSAAGRFITDGALQSNGDIALPVEAAYSLIQVVNPFAAYLNVSQFLAANSARIESAYKTWSGSMDEGFITVLPGDAMRYAITDAAALPTGAETLIPPFQSFFVMKRAGVSTFSTLTMNTGMTTTAGAKYTLRNATYGQATLRITAKTQNRQNTTVLRRDALAGTDYHPAEDARKAFLEGEPLSVYTLTDSRQALAINQMPVSSTTNVGIGLRLRLAASSLTLEFDGVEDFDQDVFLIDHALNNRRIDLKQSPAYVFAVPPSDDQLVEINERFSLRFGDPTDNEPDAQDGVNLQTLNGKIRLDASGCERFDDIAIYDLTGSTVYRQHAVPSPAFIPVMPGRLYLVKVTVNGTQLKARKVSVRP